MASRYDYQQSNTYGGEPGPPPYTERTPLYTGHRNRNRRNSNPELYGPAPTVINYTSSQLMIPNRERQILTVAGFTFILIFSFIAGCFVDAGLHTEYYNALRWAWAREEEEHSAIRVGWGSDIRKHEETRSRMAHEAERWDDQRRRWAREDEEHQETERKRKEEEQRERADRERQRKEWEGERKEWERKRKEEEERARFLLTWEDMRASERCSQYGTKKYKAKLTNVTPGLDPLEECFQKPALIHGREVLPNRCAYEGVCGAVYGHWTIDFDEKGCMPSWGAFADKGCVKSGIRRWESRLWNLNPNDDWFEMCITTPATIRGITLRSPTDCVDYGFFRGEVGIWVIPDPYCSLLQGQGPVESGTQQDTISDHKFTPLLV